MSPSAPGPPAPLRRLVEAIDAFEHSGVDPGPELGATDADAEIAPLAQRVQRLVQRVAYQAGALERAARQRRELLTNVSHDLRTPLAAMQGYLELLLLQHAHLEPAERRNYLEVAARQSERLARLVADLFQLAALDGDDAPLSCEDVALDELIHDVIQKHAPDAARRGIALRPEIGSHAQPVHADIALVERLLTGLLENALRHTPAGGSVTLQATFEPTARPRRVEVAVRDTGEGIPPADLADIFERYQRTERIVAGGAMPQGGLGLAISRRIVQLHGGELRVASRLGEGTEVCFDLPLGPQAVPPRRGPGEVSPEPLRIALQRSEAARESAEAQLRAVEQRYLLAMRGSQDGLWEWDLVSDRVELSARWKSMLGFELHEVGDDKASWLGRVHPDDRVGFEAALQRTLGTRPGDAQSFDHSLRLLHKDGSVRHVLSRGVAIRREDGVPFRVVGLDTDVTRVQRLQAVLDVLAEGTSAAQGADFLTALVRNFGRALDVDLAFIAECVDDPPTRVRTLACWRAGQEESDNFDFELSGTPCEEVICHGRTCFHREDVGRIFPRERGYQAYLGMPILGPEGRVIGHLAFFDRAPRGDEMLVDSVYRIFLARAAAEMQRLHEQRQGR